MNLEHRDPDCAGGWTQVWGIGDRAPYWYCQDCHALYRHSRLNAAAVAREFDLMEAMEGLADEGAELLKEDRNP